MTAWFWRCAVAALIVAASLPIAPPAAGGGVGVTFGFGGYPQPYYGHHRHRPPVYYGPPPIYYAPPPVYVAPPRVYYAPPPIYVEPAPTYAPTYAPPAPRGNCREYQSTAMVNGAVVPTYGTACQQPDGTWRLIN